MKIVLASNNQGKLAELQAMFGALGCTLVRQRFVVIGARDDTGAELPRLAAMLVAVLMGEVAVSLTFTALPT